MICGHIGRNHRNQMLGVIMQKNEARLGNGHGTRRFNLDIFNIWPFFICVAALILVMGCASHDTSKKDNSFFTSGSKDADQRASQRMAKAEE